MKYSKQWRQEALEHMCADHTKRNAEFPESASDDTKTYVHSGSRDRSRFLCVIDE